MGLLLKQDVATGATMMFRRCVRDLYEEIPLEWVHDGWLTWMMTLHADRVGQLKTARTVRSIYRVHQGQQTGQVVAPAGRLPIRAAHGSAPAKGPRNRS